MSPSASPSLSMSMSLSQPVVVYRLVTVDSVEVSIVKVADAKRSLEKLVLSASAPAPAGKRRKHNEADAVDASLLQEAGLRALLKPEVDVRCSSCAVALYAYVCVCAAAFAVC
jgi:hypothetical protein